MRLTLLSLIFLASLPAHADSLGADDVLMLVEEGTVMPLEEILELHPQISQSTLLDIELEREEDGQLIYEFEILNGNRVVMEFEIDARTGQLLREEFED
ncbi:PepSY domain-containing protein [Pontibacterium sp.]|uniref:PepSY domain-containing protein n=1 Tax=Pontibacterium sp. TaxID=2036026 RepID=UPI003513A648